MSWESPEADASSAFRVRRPALALLLLAFALLGTLYSAVTPVFEAPDEIQHFFYAVHLAEGGGLPRVDASSPQLWGQEGSQPPLYYALAALIIAPVDTSESASLLWLNEHANLGDPLRPDNKNRIVHTAQETWPYSSAVVAVHLARLLSVALGACTVFLVYQLGRELLPRAPAVALTAAAVTAFTPQFLFISGAVSNDNLIIFFATLASWFLARGMREPRPRGWRLCMGLLLGLAALSKLSGLALWALAGGVLLLQGMRRRAWRRAAGDIAVVLAVALATAGWWYVRNWILYGDPTALSAMLSVVGRYQAPPSLRDLLGQLEGLRLSYWGVFGWFNLLLPEWFYRVLDVLTAASVLGLIFRALKIGRRWPQPPADRLRSDWRLVLPAAWICLMVASLIRYTMLTPATQGRLLLPAAWAINLSLALGWGMWSALLSGFPTRFGGAAGSERWRRWIAAGSLGLPVVLLGACAAIAPFAVIRPAYEHPTLATPGEVPEEARRAPVVHGTQARFLGGSIEPDTAHPGDTVWITVYWEVLEPFDRDYTVYVHLNDREGSSVAQSNSWPGSGGYPTRLWRPGTVVVDRHPLQIPGGAPAPALLAADTGFFIAKTGEHLATGSGDGDHAVSAVGTLRLLPRTPMNYTPSRPREARFGQDFALLGYDLSPSATVTPGQSLAVVLYWRSDRRLATDERVFLHLRTLDGAILAQADGEPMGGSWPTSAWEPGQLVADARTLEIPEDALPDPYALWVGLYGGEGDRRLPVTGVGARVEDDALYLGEVSVRED